MVAETLTVLNDWFKEPTAGNERPRLLSKLATLELCGWLEGWMDELIIQLSRECLKDDDWVTSNVIKRTHGFDYVSHLRPMFCKILGEHLTRVLELEYDKANPGDLDRIKSTLKALWKQRCEFAHSDLITNVATQSTFDAPSLVQVQHEMLQKKLEALKLLCNTLAKAAHSLNVSK
jgi:hypothetical protein